MPTDEAERTSAEQATPSPWRLRPLLVLIGDAVIAVLSLVVAYHLRFDDPSPYLGDLPLLAATLVIARLLVNVRLRLHYWSFKFSNLRDGARIAAAAVSGSAVFVALGYFVLRDHVSLPPRGVVVLELLLSSALMAAIRFGPRLAFTYRADLWPRRRRGVVRALIAGAGASGEMLLRDLQRGSHDPERGLDELHVVGFVDDDRRKWGHIVGGKPVLGPLDDLPRLAARHRVELVVLAIVGLPSSRLREILSLSFQHPMRFKILPTSYGQLHDRDIAAALRDVSEADLLVREVLTFDHQGAAPSVDPERQLLVAGAAGSIGSEVCRQLLELGARRLVLLDLDENGLYVLKRRFEREYPGREIVAEVADLREPRRLSVLLARYRPRDIFHAAARKHVPLMEAAPCEAVKTNVVGTLNLARVAEAYGAERFVYTSTDKAVRPTSVMGATKKIGEMLMRALDTGTEPGVRFIVVRFGNVLDSAGSVVPLFREQIAAGGPVTVTHPEIQRYFMTISEAVGLVLRAAYGDYGRLCVLEMGEPLRIVDLARQMITMAGLVPDIDIGLEFTGLRPGEKLFEELMAADEEVEERIETKIRVVRAPAPRADLLEQVEELARRAVEEDEAGVVAMLRQLVPDYRRGDVDTFDRTDSGAPRSDAPHASASERVAGSLG